MDLFELGVKIDTTQITKAEKAIDSLMKKISGVSLNIGGGSGSGSGGDTTAPIERRTKAVERFAKMTNTVAGVMEYQKQAMDAINKSYDKGKFSVELYNTAVGNVKTKVESAINTINRKSEAFRQQQADIKKLEAEQKAYNSVMEKSQILASKTNLRVTMREYADKIKLEKQNASEVLKAERAEATLERKRNSLASTTASLEGVTFRYNQKMKEINNTFPESIRDTDRYRAAVANAHAEYQNSINRINAYSKIQEIAGTKTRLARHEMLNLSYQLQDIIVGFASGQRPMTIFVQQGSQIAGIAASAGLGLKGMASAMWSLTKGVLASTVAFASNPIVLTLMAIVGAVYAVKKAFESDLGIKKAENDLGRLGVESDKFKEKLKELGGGVVTFGDVLYGLTGGLVNFSSWKKAIGDGFDWIKEKVRVTTLSVAGFFGGVQKALATELAGGDREARKASFWQGFEEGYVNTEARILARSKSVIGKALTGTLVESITPLDSILNRTLSPIERIKKEWNDSKKAIEENYKITATLNGGLLDSVEATGKRIALNRLDAYYQKQIADEIKRQNKDQIKLGEKRDDIISRYLLNYDNEIAKAKALTDEQKAQLELKKLENELASKKMAPLSDSERKVQLDKIKEDQEAKKAAEEYARQQELINQAVANAKTPLDAYQDSIMGITLAWSENKLTTEQYNKLLKEAENTYTETQDPLRSYKQALDEETKALGMSNDERELYNYQLQLEATYKKELVGATNERKQAIYEEIAALVERKKQLIGQQRTQTRIEGYKSPRTVKDITSDVSNLKEDYKNKSVDVETYTNKLNALNKEYLNLQVTTGKATFMEGMQLSMINFLGDYKNIMGQVSNITTNFLDSFSSGFADAFAGAIVKGDNLKESLQNVSQTILTELVSALIQMGVKYAIGTALGETMTAKQLLNIQAVSTAQTVATAKGTAESTAAAATVATNAGTVAAASAPAAATTSTWSFGAAAAAGAAGMLALLAVAKMFTGGFKEGGYTGNFGTSDVAGVVHGQEFVVNAQATAKNRALLEAMNNGATVTSGGSATATTQATNNMTYNHTSQITVNGNPDNTTLTLIAQAVEQGAKKGYALVAQDFKNNGNIRKLAVGNK